MKVSSVSNMHHTNTVQKKNGVSFGYNFFLKGVNLPCAYCGEQMLSIPNLKQFAKALDGKKGQDAANLIHRNYAQLNERSKAVVDILYTTILQRRKLPVNEVILDLAKSYEGKTNDKYGNAVLLAYAKSGIQQGGPLDVKLAHLIERSQEELFHETPNSAQKTLRITYLQNGMQNLINATHNQTEKAQLKKFLTSVNSSFNDIKEDPTTFFAKFGQEPIQSFLGSLFAPIRSTADHIVTASNDGVSESANYIAVCGKCNWARDEKPFKEFVHSHPKVITNIKKQFSLLDAMLSPQFPKPHHTPAGLPDNIFKYLMEVQETIKEQLGEPIRMDLPFFKERAAKLFGLNQ